MQIKKKKHRNHITFKYIKKKTHLRIPAGIAIFIFILVILFNISLIRNFSSKIRELLSLKSTQALSIIQAKPEIITFDIGFEDFQLIKEQREIGLQRGLLFSSDLNFVSAKISTNNSKYDAKIRLKGVDADHWKDNNKWSFKIRIKEDKALFGMDEFSVMHPFNRDFIDEWIYSLALKKENLLYPRIKYVEVHVNGKNNGIYILEEDFSNSLISNNQRREGVLMGFNKDLIISEWHRIINRQNHIVEGTNTFDAMTSEFVSMNRQVSDSNSTKAINILEAFKREELSLSEVFNIDDVAKLFALRAIFSSGETEPNDAKFYFNPITSKLELYIPEIHKFSRVGNWWINQEGPRQQEFLNLFFNDDQFYELYLKYLNNYIDDNYIENLINDNRDSFNENISIINREFPKQKFDIQGYQDNITYIKESLNPTQAINAFFQQKNSNSIVLQILNLQSQPIEIISATYSGSINFEIRENEIIRPVNVNTLEKYIPITLHSTQQLLPVQLSPADIVIKYKILGSDNLKEVAVLPYGFDTEAANLGIIGKPNIQNSSNFDFNIKTGEYKPNKSNVIIYEDLIIPDNSYLVVDQASHIILENNSRIYSYSPLKFYGTESNPIRVSSLDGTGQGIVVINADEGSIMQNVIFENLTVNSETSNYTGAVTFYRSSVTCFHCNFSNINAEDSLNIINSDFIIENSSFSSSSNDAIDLDFSNGKISDSQFISSGNDAIDISFGTVNLSGIKIIGSQDKGISIGENSVVTGNDIDIRDTFLALASKDKSRTIINGLNILNSTYGIAVYQKKPEFGPANMVVTNLLANGASVPIELENDSTLNIDFSEINPNRKNVYKFLYPTKNEK